jgi:hypothetical protein
MPNKKDGSNIYVIPNKKAATCLSKKCIPVNIDQNKFWLWLMAACHKVHEVNNLSLSPAFPLFQRVSIFDTPVGQWGQWRKRHNSPGSFLLDSQHYIQSV